MLRMTHYPWLQWHLDEDVWLFPGVPEATALIPDAAELFLTAAEF